MTMTKTNAALRNNYSRIKRKSPRYSPGGKLVATFTLGKRKFTGEVREISRSGLFLSSEELPMVGSEGKVSITFSDWFLQADAVVRMIKPGRGFGVELLKLNARDQETLASYCGYLHRFSAVGKRGR